MTSSSAKIYVGMAADFSENSRQLVKYGARNIAVVYYKMRFYAIDNACYHYGGPLLQGDIEEMGGHVCIVCPWHSYRIALTSGEGLYVAVTIDQSGAKPATVVRSKGCKQRVHTVVVEDGKVFVEVDLSGPAWESDTYANMAMANQEAGMAAPVACGGPLRHGSGPSLHSGVRSGDVLQQLKAGRGGINPLDVHRSTAGVSPLVSQPGSRAADLVVSCCKMVDVCRGVKEYHFARASGTLLRHGEMGKYVEIELPIKDADGAPLKRKWTICDTSERGVLFTLIVKANSRNPSGGSMWMHRHALHCRFPVHNMAGHFTFVDHMARIREVQGHVLWLSAGIGITSAYANIASTFNDAFFISDGAEKLRVVHIHVDQTADSVAKLDVFLQWARQFPPGNVSDPASKYYHFHGYLSQQREAGKADKPGWASAFTYGRRLGLGDIHDAAKHFFASTPFLCYVCGPPSFCNDCSNALLSIGVDEKDILMDDV